MAKVKLNPVLEAMQGQVGDLVFKHYGDEVFVGRKPDRSGLQPTEAQLDHQERFRQAVLYGRLVMADPEKKVLYEKAAQASGKPLFSLTVADFFNAPAVDAVDLSAYSGTIGNEIVIQAQDDFEVTSVHVNINDAGGQAMKVEAP